MRNKSIPFFKVILGLLGLIILGTWPTDYLNFNSAELIRAYFIWRVVFLTGICFFFLGLNFTKVFRKYLFTLLYGGTLATVAATGFIFGNVENITIQSPWFYFIFILPFISTCFSIRIYRRIVGTILIPVTYAFAMLGLDTGADAWGYPFLGVNLNLVGATIVLSILLGHFLYHLNRENYFQSRQRKIRRKKIEELAAHDQLTGLYNRREFEKRLREELTRINRYEEKLSILMMDLDHFKEINDNYGHQTGDEVLRFTGNLIQNETRRTDVACRYGGEEFCIGLIETPMDKARGLAERLRKRLSEKSFSSDGSSFEVTCSIGIAEFQTGDKDYSSLLERTDEALYEAKHRGRNRVVVAS